MAGIVGDRMRFAVGVREGERRQRRRRVGRMEGRGQAADLLGGGFARTHRES